MYEPKCGDPEPHYFHNFIDMHFKELHCGGVCNCGMRGGVHGPGEHK